MSQPDLHAPARKLFIEGEELREDISSDVAMIECSEMVDTTGEMTIDIVNANGKYSDSKIFNPGNEIDVYMGYGQDLKFVGRGEIIRQLPIFPERGVPSLKLTLQDHSWRMKKSGTQITGSSKVPKRKLSKQEAGEAHQGSPASILREIGERNGFVVEVHDRLESGGDFFVQQKGMSDWEVLKAMVNFYDSTFRVEYRHEAILPTSFYDFSEAADALEYVGQGQTRTGQWYIVIDDVFDLSRQKTRSIFKYGGPGDPLSSITRIDFDYAVDHMVSEVVASYWDPHATDTPDGRTGGWREVSLDAVEAGGDDPFHHKGLSQKARAAAVTEPTKLKLSVSGYALTVITKPFRSAEEARKAIAEWFERNRDAFIIARGTLVGNTFVRAGDVHELKSDLFGERYGGLYLFSEVKHMFGGPTGWKTEFTGRRAFK